MDVIDTQVHVGPGGIPETLAAMDALGIQAIVIDEFWMGTAPGNPGFEDPVYRVGDGGWRTGHPTAELASYTHPDRFCYMARVDRNDPEVGSVIRLLRDKPQARALRILPVLWKAERAAFAAGEYDAICAAACDAGLPVFMYINGQADVVAHYARKFPSLKIMVDHCGVMGNLMRRFFDGDAPTLSREGLLDAFDEVLALADLPNVALRWIHAHTIFEAPGYANQELWPVLRKALDRFGADRVMWGSDWTYNLTNETWGELLFSVRAMPDLSQAEREALLGGTARKWLNWPA